MKIASGTPRLRTTGERHHALVLDESLSWGCVGRIRWVNIIIKNWTSQCFKILAKLLWKSGAGGPLLLQMLLLTVLGSGIPASQALAAALLQQLLRELVPESHSQPDVPCQAAGCPTPYAQT